MSREQILEELQDAEAKIAGMEAELAILRLKPVRLRKLDPAARDSFARPVRPGMPPALLLGVDAQPAKKPAKVAAPVWPNAGVQAWYQVQLQSITTDMQAEIVPAISEAYNQTAPLLGFATDAPSRSVRAKIVLDKWSGRWVVRLDKLSLDLADKFADKSFSATQVAMKKSFADAGLTVKFKPTRASMEAYRSVVADNVALIKSVPAQYSKDVQAKVWDSVQRGGDLGSLVTDLRKSYGVAQRRAEVIARTENNKAKAVIEQTRRVELGIKEAIWMHSSAGKEPRPTHVAMNGKRYKIKTGMYDPDPRVAAHILPGELIECRCSSRTVIPGFEDE